MCILRFLVFVAEIQQNIWSHLKVSIFKYLPSKIVTNEYICNHEISIQISHIRKDKLLFCFYLDVSSTNLLRMGDPLIHIIDRHLNIFKLISIVHLEQFPPAVFWATWTVQLLAREGPNLGRRNGILKTFNLEFNLIVVVPAKFSACSNKCWGKKCNPWKS